MEPLVSLDELEYISGPISLYYFQYGGRNFYFFGDIHEDRAFSCPYMVPYMPCSHIEADLKTYQQSNRCSDIVSLMRTIFERARQEGIYVDFFLEYFFRDNDEKHTEDNIAKALHIMAGPEYEVAIQSMTEEEHAQQIKAKQSVYDLYDDLDYISRLYTVFNSCFKVEKASCPYAPYVRFHYADIRSIATEKAIIDIFPIMLEDVYIETLIKLMHDEEPLTPIEEGTIKQYSILLLIGHLHLRPMY